MRWIYISVFILIILALIIAILIWRHSKQKEISSMLKQKLEADEAMRALEMQRRVDESLKEELARRADIDPVTEIYNRTAFFRLVKEKLERDPDGHYVIVCFDIDRFKVFNDIFGSVEGDRFLKRMGQRLSEIDGSDNVCAHLSADHFCLFGKRSEVEPDSILKETKTWLQEDEIQFDITMRAGVYVVEDSKPDPELMTDRAMLALKSIKGSEVRRVGYYNEELRQKLIEEQQMIGDLKTAFEQEQFDIWFQPQFDYDKELLVGAEALVRWNHPGKGILLPDVFIPIMESNGIITKLDEYVWDKCCQYIRKWMDTKPEFMKMNIAMSANLSRVSIYKMDLCKKLLELTDKYNIPRDMLRIEITESAYMDNPKQLIETVGELRDAGFIIEMDDFGSGYSSLNTLKDVEVDILKLDMRFLDDTDNPERSGNILSSIVRMARWLNLPVIAEGVETAEQAEYLKSIGCTMMQGFYFKRPMPANAFEQYMSQKSMGNVGDYVDVNTEKADYFWDASAQSALIFNSYIGGAAILEFDKASNNIEILRTNDGFFTEVGTTRAEYEKWMTHINDRLQEGYSEKLAECIRDTIEKGESSQLEIESIPFREGNRTQWLLVRLQLLSQTATGAIIYATINNITERKRLEIKNEVLNSRLTAVVENMPGGVVSFNFDGEGFYQTEHNEGITKLFGFSQEEYNDIKKGDSLRWVHPDDMEKIRETLRRGAENPFTYFTCDGRMKAKSGEWKWVRFIGHMREKVDNISTGTLLIISIDDVVKSREDLRIEAEKDETTGILNKKASMKKISNHIIGRKNERATDALFIIDIDDFKRINDNYGHRVGDKVLRKFAAELTGLFRKDDIVGRFGGDEFLVYLKSVDGIDTVTERAQAIIDSAKNVEVTDGETITCSAGIIIIDDDTNNYNQWFDSADFALYVSKHNGKNRYTIFDPDKMDLSV